jgi:rubrerythrin
VRRRQQETESKTIELLSERLAFERTGVKLYDRIVRKIVDARGGDGIADAEEVAEQLEVFRDEEKEHEEWLEDRIRERGSDPNEQTDRSVLVQEESKGIVDVVLESERPLAEMLHALLAAELIDGAGWELLAQIPGDEELLERCRQYQREEQRHLSYVKKLILGFETIPSRAKVQPIGSARSKSGRFQARTGSRRQKQASQASPRSRRRRAA